MSINARQKGKRGELELAEYLRSQGHDARRSQQFCGRAGDSDITSTSLSAYHIECKRTEAGTLYTWLAQAIRECGQKIPVVMHRRNKQDWVAVLRLSDFLKLVNLPETELR